ncbi:guanosine monophosphate reductase [Candidatus Gottesmanbacteria bacterium RIFCSPHIGHO2_02_FULL_39_11]|uniref:Guanosine monophosphate reductase n=1 Tax=Candidatus Gottesmanbacteria bacterium RIFCSPHIGHO2_02_FULL_39_11 TaxID=1798382 RepID=A0A1F5ZMT2_9BACT|nr:MAG: guanosine monophosphate reductase [Candidatus Gottesmanbacteria bacterium RIFCSPHIGHO2_02_FULL_39_11]
MYGSCQESNVYKMKIMKHGLAYDDVLLIPGFADFKREETDVSIELPKGIHLSIPILSSPMDTVTMSGMAITLGNLGGMGFIHRNMPIEKEVNEIKKAKNKTKLVGAAVGVGKDFEERLKGIIDGGADAVLIDSAHGFTKYVIEATSYIKEKYPKVLLISGNIATQKGAKALIDAGADVLRVGMGPGSICTTRIVSGMGVPQITALEEAVKAANEKQIPIIADGGIRYSGDIVKSLAIGANLVMLGSLLGATDEAPGEITERNGEKYKTYRGMGSVSAMKEGSAARYGQEYRKGQEKKLVPEGVEGLVRYRGSVEDVISQLVGGLRTGMYYVGARTIQELQEKAEFIQITQASLIESFPHDIIRF